MPDAFGIPSGPEPDFTDNFDVQRLCAELMETRARLSQFDKEALSLYEPQEYQEAVHRSTARNVLITGGVRSGKTLVACVEDARCVTNQDPFKKYPNKGLLILIGFGWKHIGNVFYPKLFKPGAFKIIRDKKTRKWRAFRPWFEDDLEREHECEDAPPLISPRFYDPKDIAWEYRGQDQMAKVRLKTGWEIWCFSSEANPDGMQGFAADRAHIDEDVNKEQFVSEAQSRLIDKRGCLCWSAMPHSANAIRAEMSEKANEDREKGVEDPTIVEFVMPFTDNKFVDEKTKKQKLEEWALAGDDVLRMRAYGHYTFNAQSMYPTFHLKFHGYKRERLEKRDIPRDWTRFVAIDPGFQVAAAVFGAVPPNGKMCLVYDEVRVEQCDAKQLAEAMKQHIGDDEIEAFIIDAHGARIRDFGSGKNAWDQYQEAFEEAGVKCNMSGSSFVPGLDKVASRAEAVRLALRTREDGGAFVQFLVEDDGASATPHLVKALSRYRRKKCPKTGVVLDEPETRGDVHHAQCLEYLLSYSGLKYVPPRRAPVEAAKQWELIKKQFDEYDNRCRRQTQTNVVHFGPASLRNSA